MVAAGRDASKRCRAASERRDFRWARNLDFGMFAYDSGLEGFGAWMYYW